MTARIAVVIESLGGGGAQQVAARLMQHWIDQGVAVSLVTFQGEAADTVQIDPQVSRLVIGGTSVSRGILQAIAANYGRLRALRRAIRDSGAETVVAFVTTTNILAILASMGLGVRIIVSERNDTRRQPLSMAWRLLRRIVYPLADKVTANTKSAIEDLSSYVATDKLALVPNPIRSDGNTATLSNRTPFFLSVGRLHQQKNFELLFQAFGKIAKYLDWRLCVLGEGNLRGKLNDLAETLGIAERLDLPGYVENPFPYYRAGGIFILCSLYEGSPNALLEAMSSGCAVIVTDNLPGALEFVKHLDTGLVVAAGNSDALAEAMLELASNPPLNRRLGQAAQAEMYKYSVTTILSAWDKALWSAH